MRYRRGSYGNYPYHRGTNRRRRVRREQPLSFVILIAIITVLALGLMSRLGEGFQNFSAQQSALAQQTGDKETVETVTETAQTSSLRRFLLWILGYDPSDPMSILKAAFPGKEYIPSDEDSQEASTTPGEFENEESSVSPVEISSIPDDLLPIQVTGNGPKVLIYHTHTQESYKKTTENYAEMVNSRTSNNDYNVVRIGEELAGLLNNKYGIETLHDTKNYEVPKLSTAYTRSLEGIKQDIKDHPQLKVFFDIHRDAYNASSKIAQTVTIDGKKVARFMVVIGTGEGQSSNGFTEKPNWKENYKLALRITNELNKIDPNLCKQVSVKSGRYNQHVSPYAVLIEVGNNGNTLDEVLSSIPYLAEVLSKVIPAV